MPQDANLTLLRDEVMEMLGDLDTVLLELDKSPSDKELLNRAFRDIHTVKGACDMFGLSAMVAFAHDMETVFDQVRNGKLPFNRELLDLSFAAKDILLAMLDDPEAEEEKELDVLTGFQRLLEDGPSPGPKARGVSAAPPPAAPAASGNTGDGRETAAQAVYRIVYKPSGQGLLSRFDPIAVLDDLRGLGTCEITALISKIPELQNIDPLTCLVAWEIILRTDKGKNALEDVFIFIENPADVTIEELREPPANTGQQKSVAAPIPAPIPAAKPASQAGGAVQPAPSTPAPQKPVPASPALQKAGPPPQAPAAAAKKESQSLRVDAAKLDSLVDLVGELVIAQSRLSQLAAGINHPGLVTVAEEIERLSNDLRDNTLNIRMLPIGTTFSKFRRLVRDLSAEMSKEIELVTEGAETELDKTVIEQLGDPLVHLLRNSIDHGVEPPAERIAKGKPAKGTIQLSAEHAGGEVVIRIVDDGQGIDTHRVREKAVERGLIASDARPTEQELFMLIFAPGFSTAQKITNVSGRGVGMDVVKRSIDQLRGKIEIHSAQGKGTTITIRLPLTLAIIDGLMIKAGEEHYIIPLTLVEECVEFSQTMQSDRKRTISLRGEIVPYVRLREAFDIEGASPPIEQIVITRSGDERTGVAVDEVVGQLQTVIKSLGKIAGNVAGIAGATIRADGSLALIIDVPGLIQSIEHGAGKQ